jgi:hypothetical protein
MGSGNRQSSRLTAHQESKQVSRASMREVYLVARRSSG